MSRFSGLARNEEGAVAVWVGIGLLAMIPIAALVFDLARVEVTYTELKQAADAAALAGATQLRGETDSIDKATKAAEGAAGGSGIGLADNRQTWAEGGSGSVKIEHIRFFSKLNPDTVTTNGTDANFIEVSVTSTKVKNWFIPVAQGATGLGESNPTAFAVAGYGKSFCQVSPLMVCNPAEDKGGTFSPQPGQQVWVKMQSAGAGNPAWGPGDFGLLDLPNGQQGANAISDAFAKKNPFTGCYGSEVNTDPGQKSSVSDGINTRLDIYVQSAKSYANDKDAYPAYNVTKGLLWTGGCGKAPSQGTLDTYTGPSDSNQAVAGLVQYPRDNCIYAGNCTLGTRFGDGNWNRALYWATNHPTIAQAARPAGWNTWTRYATYRWEVDNDVPPAVKTVPNNSASGGENGIPQCYKATNSLPGGKIPKGADARTLGPINWGSNPDRRVLMTAVVNCKAEGVHGNTSNVKVQKWMLMFLTEAVGYYVGGDDNDLLMEVIREIDVDQDKNIAHQIVQLYR